jgi:uncharacterized OsmC-like protein
MAQSEIRSYSVKARSTDTFGRVVCSARQQHFVVDGPVQNGAPGEAVTPGELFLGGVAACGVELVQAFARSEEIALRAVNVEIFGTLDRGNPVRPDLSVFNSVRVSFELQGVTEEEGARLIDRFKGR